MIALPVCLRHGGTRSLRSKSVRVITRNVNLNRSTVLLPPQHSVYLKMLSVREDQQGAIYDHVKQHVVHDDSCAIIQVRAGSGHLTEMLLDAGVKNLHVFEKRLTHKKQLQEIVAKYPGQAVYHGRTINELLFESNNIPPHDSHYLDKSLPVKLKRAWKDSPSLKLIGANATIKVLLVALYHISKNMMYLGMGRPQFILTVPLPVWDKLLNLKPSAHYHDYHIAGLLFPDFFEFKVLGSIPPPVYYDSGTSTKGVSKDEFVTVSIAPSADMEDLLSPAFMDEFFFFGTQTMNGKAKHSFVIPSVEKWAPGSGRELVIKGVNCFTRFKEIDATEAFRIFSIWRSSPYYDTSVFKREFEDDKLYKD